MRLAGSRRLVGWTPFRAAALLIAFAGLLSAAAPAPAHAVLEERKLPMRFNWVACQPNCGGWISAVGIVTAETPKDFETFARGRPLAGATIVLDSSGGSVNDAITLGRRWRKLGLMTTVGTSIEIATASGARPAIAPGAYCESMCVFLLLAGQTRHVPAGAHVRVHQIWMGDRADDARAAIYSAQDLMIVERDIGRLAKYTFDMGGTGDLLALALSVPPWEDLHELSPAEIRGANLITTEAIADLLPSLNAGGAVAGIDTKKQDRFASDNLSVEPAPAPSKSTKTAEAALPTGGVAVTPAAAPPSPH